MPLNIDRLRRNCYGGFDFKPIFDEIEVERKLQLQFKKKTNAVEVVAARHLGIKYKVTHKYYRLWKLTGKQETFVVTDNRKNNKKLKALPMEVESKISKTIINMYHSHQLVSYHKISQIAKSEWHLIHSKAFRKFKASDGWIYNYLKRWSLSSQAVSLRSSSRNHTDLIDRPKEVLEFSQKFLGFLEINGKDNVINFDETSFGVLSGNIRTVAPKGVSRQPRIINRINGRGLSVGCAVTATGEKLKTLLVAKGRSRASLKKYKDYQKDPRCILSYSPSGWFTENQILVVLDVIHKYTKGAPSMCIWDSYRAHCTAAVVSKAKTLNIQLLEVPKGLTWALQPLDTTINGPYKQKMLSYWLKNSYNEDLKGYHRNICDTVLNCYDDLKKSLILKAFQSLVEIISPP